MKKIVTLLIVAGLVVTSAVGKDLNPPPWEISLPNQTYQAWDFTMQGPPFPLIDENPYGVAELMDYAATWPVPVEGPDGFIIDTMHIEEPGGLTIWVPNNKDPELKKLIFWQMTSDKSPTPTGVGPTTTTPGGQTGTNLPAPYPHIQHAGTWYTYNGLIEIRPNPEGEWITFPLLASTNIEQIVIKTVCVPEPCTISLLVLGGLVLRRRKK